MSLSLKERFARQGAVQVIDRVRSGSPAVLALIPLRDPVSVKPVSAALALVRRHVPMLRAKRTIEAMLCDGRAFIEVPMVEDLAILRKELRSAAVDVRARPPEQIDVQQVRARTGFTQEQFALRYQIDIATLRNWEQGRNEPDVAARSYLRMIAAHPQQVEDMLWDGAAGGR